MREKGHNDSMRGSTSIEKAADFSRRLSSDKSDGDLKPPSAQTVRERSSLTGFTLTELLIVVVIIGVLASIVIPNYTIQREKALDKTAINAVKLIAIANRQYFAKYGFYSSFSDGGAWNDNVGSINDQLNLALSPGGWYIRLQGTRSGTVDSYIVQACKGGSPAACGSGGMRVFTITPADDEPVCDPCNYPYIS